MSHEELAGGVMPLAGDNRSAAGDLAPSDEKKSRVNEDQGRADGIEEAPAAKSRPLDFLRFDGSKLTLEPELMARFLTVARDATQVDQLVVRLDQCRESLHYSHRRLQLPVFAFYAIAAVAIYVWGVVTFVGLESWGEWPSMLFPVGLYFGFIILMVQVARFLFKREREPRMYLELLGAIRACDHALEEPADWERRAAIGRALHDAAYWFEQAVRQPPKQATPAYAKWWRTRARAGSVAIFSGMSATLSGPDEIAGLRDDLVRVALRVNGDDWPSVGELRRDDFDETLTMSLWRRMRPQSTGPVLIAFFTAVAGVVKLLLYLIEKG